MQVSGVILAGGISSRMGTSKPFVNFKNQPLINHVIEGLRPQVDELLININETFKTSYIIFKDEMLNYPGPLAGISAAFNQAQHDWIQFCPCDSPYINKDLVAQLLQNADKASVITPICNNKIHPTFSLIHKSMQNHLKKFLASGERKFTNWLEQAKYIQVNFDNEVDFLNINTPEDLKKYEKD
jgi:molybdopterin-guanine dinucleotide biosynthesis protein A